ncbi:MAG: 2-C-methyl-D-erythritol 4-phosphate cytidylyltransferase [Nocardioidaceae bacterium]
MDPIVLVQGGQVVDFAARDKYWRGQSPQGFWLGDLREAMLVNANDVNRYATVFEMLMACIPNFRVEVVDGELNNLKITAPVDHMIAGRLLVEAD